MNIKRWLREQLDWSIAKLKCEVGGFKIEDGTGNSYEAEVTDEHQLKTVAEIHELQHHISHHDQQVYQVIGEVLNVNPGTNTILHITNESTTHNMTATYIRVQAVDLYGGSTIPSSGTYFQIGRDTTYTSNGTATTPVNMYFASANSADVSAYKDNPTLGGSFTEFDRWYLEADGKMMTFNKHGSVMVGQNDAFEIRFITDAMSGVAYCRLTFCMIRK